MCAMIEKLRILSVVICQSSLLVNGNKSDFATDGRQLTRKQNGCEIAPLLLRAHEFLSSGFLRMEIVLQLHPHGDGFPVFQGGLELYARRGVDGFLCETVWQAGDDVNVGNFSAGSKNAPQHDSAALRMLLCFHWVVRLRFALNNRF